MAQEETAADLTMDSASLFHEETFTDRKVGTIRRLTPVTADGAPDSKRAVVYVGQAQLLTPMGALPLAFEIPAVSLTQAVALFGTAAQQAADSAMEELNELRRQAASSIIVPGMGGSPAGKIKLP